MSVIVNTTVISNFAAIQRIDLLLEVYGKLYIPMEVNQELQASLKAGQNFYPHFEQFLYPVSEARWIRLTTLADEAELLFFVRLPAKLHSGERACIAIAHQRGYLFLTDDLAARKEAQRLGITVSGSLGALMGAVDAEYCSLAEANAWLQQMIEQGYHSPVQDLTEISKR